MNYLQEIPDVSDNDILKTEIAVRPHQFFYLVSGPADIANAIYGQKKNVGFFFSFNFFNFFLKSKVLKSNHVETVFFFFFFWAPTFFFQPEKKIKFLFYTQQCC